MPFLVGILKALITWFFIAVVVDLASRTVSVVLPMIKVAFTFSKNSLKFAK